MLYRFTDTEASILLELAAQRLTLIPVQFINQKPVPSFMVLCRIVSELTEPTAGAFMVEPPSANAMRLSIEDGTREASAAEGIDLERELGVYDKRAFDPKCIHGRSIKGQPCADCTPAPGSAFEFKLGEDEQKALDAALAERLRAMGAPSLAVPELERVPVVSIKHRDFCAAAFEGERRPDLQYPCSCDFGRRLAAEMGMEYGATS